MTNFDAQSKRRRRYEACERWLDRIFEKHGWQMEWHEKVFIALDAEKRLGDISLREVRSMKMYDEFQVVGIADDFVAAGRAAYSMSAEDVANFAENALPNFAKQFNPELTENRKVLGMVSAELLSDEAAKEAKRRGLIILRLDEEECIVVENFDGARPVASLPA